MWKHTSRLWKHADGRVSVQEGVCEWHVCKRGQASASMWQVSEHVSTCASVQAGCGSEQACVACVAHWGPRRGRAWLPGPPPDSSCSGPGPSGEVDPSVAHVGEPPTGSRGQVLTLAVGTHPTPGCRPHGTPLSREEAEPRWGQPGCRRGLCCPAARRDPPVHPFAAQAIPAREAAKAQSWDTSWPRVWQMDQTDRQGTAGHREECRPPGRPRGQMAACPAQQAA